MPSLSAIDWAPVIAALGVGERFVLTTHVRPDTDGIGSEIALHRHLARLGKQARILNPDALAPRLGLLDPDRAVERFRPEDESFVHSATLIVLDLSECSRLGPLAPIAERHRGTSICIDHHINVDRRFAGINVIEPSAPATGVLIGELLHAMKAEVDPVIATALYATIVADTGSFRHSNTTSAVMRLAANFIDLGANPERVHRAVLGSYSREKVKLLGAALEGCVFACDGRLAWFAVSRELLRRTGAREDDAEGLIEYLRLVDGVQAAILFLETGSDKVKLSLRSEGGFDVNQIAARFGGGGHRQAAGATLAGPLEEVVKNVVEAARQTLFG